MYINHNLGMGNRIQIEFYIQNKNPEITLKTTIPNVGMNCHCS